MANQTRSMDHIVIENLVKSLGAVFDSPGFSPRRSRVLVRPFPTYGRERWLVCDN
jgi:hypothetical protein